jgi:hypothetical protein
MRVLRQASDKELLQSAQPGLPTGIDGSTAEVADMISSRLGSAMSWDVLGRMDGRQGRLAGVTWLSGCAGHLGNCTTLSPPVDQLISL